MMMIRANTMYRMHMNGTTLDAKSPTLFRPPATTMVSRIVKIVEPTGMLMTGKVEFRDSAVL